METIRAHKLSRGPQGWCAGTSYADMWVKNQINPPYWYAQAPKHVNLPTMHHSRLALTALAMASIKVNIHKGTIRLVQYCPLIHNRYIYDNISSSSGHQKMGHQNLSTFNRILVKIRHSTKNMPDPDNRDSRACEDLIVLQVQHLTHWVIFVLQGSN